MPIKQGFPIAFFVWHRGSRILVFTYYYSTRTSRCTVWHMSYEEMCAIFRETFHCTNQRDPNKSLQLGRYDWHIQPYQTKSLSTGIIIVVVITTYCTILKLVCNNLPLSTALRSLTRWWVVLTYLFSEVLNVWYEYSTGAMAKEVFHTALYNVTPNHTVRYSTHHCTRI